MRTVIAIGPRAALLFVLLVAFAGCGGTAAPTSDPTAGPASAAAALPKVTAKRAERRRQPRARGSAAAALAAVPVKGRAPKTGYDREQFGDGWLSVAGCDTRDRMLRRDLTAKRYLDVCRVESGTLADPYTAARIAFERGGASEVDIDHVVALGDAWQKGAQQWSHQRRVRFANDPLNLLSVDASANRAKGDGDAATWLPANKRFRCDYVARQVAVKTKYELWVTRAEHDAIARVLAKCPGEKLPRIGRSRVPVVSTHVDPVRAATTVTPRKRSPQTRSRRGHTYANCDAARAAGVAPIMRGTPEYDANPSLDRDRDGVACE
jgi:hypothetical protein